MKYEGRNSKNETESLYSERLERFTPVLRYSEEPGLCDDRTRLFIDIVARLVFLARFPASHVGASTACQNATAKTQRARRKTRRRKKPFASSFSLFASSRSYLFWLRRSRAEEYLRTGVGPRVNVFVSSFEFRPSYFIRGFEFRSSNFKSAAPWRPPRNFRSSPALRASSRRRIFLKTLSRFRTRSHFPSPRWRR